MTKTQYRNSPCSIRQSLVLLSPRPVAREPRRVSRAPALDRDTMCADRTVFWPPDVQQVAADSPVLPPAEAVKEDPIVIDWDAARPIAYLLTFDTGGR